MNAKSFITIICALIVSGSVRAQEAAPADSLVSELQEVVVTARQPATHLEGTTLVSTIPGSNLAGLGTLLDVLAQLPMIRVEDDAVSVIGKNNVEIYIDGRPMRDDLELQQILSSEVRKVELQMAPGAAYDSTTGAVLKITTRRDIGSGLSLTDRFESRMRRRWSVSDYLGLSYRVGRWELFADATVTHDNTLVKGTTTNTLMFRDRETVVGSSQHNSYPTTVGVLRGGFSYSAGPQSFGAYYRYNPERADFTNGGSEWLDDNPPVLRDIDRRIRSHGHLVSVYYENKFSDSCLLHFDGDFKTSVTRNRTSTTYPDNAVEDVNARDRRRSTLWAGKLYVTLPLRGGELTVGTQDSRTHTSLDYRMLNQHVGEYIPSTLTDARQTSLALFASWSRMFGPFSLSAGARFEYVDYDFKSDGKRDGDVSRSDRLLTPDISLGYSFNDDAQLSLSYKTSSVRPPYSQLTGSLNYVGMHEIEGGNPALRDERMHDVQLFGSWNGFMLQADFMRSIDSYAFVKQLLPRDDLQLLLHPVNIDVSALSAYLVWSKPVGRWTPNATFGFYRQWLKLDGQRYDRPIFSYYFDNTFALPAGWTLTAGMSGSSRGDMHTNRFGSNLFTMDASVGKSFMGGALTVKLSATDIFNTANNDWTMNTAGVFVDKRQSYDRRGILLGVIYKLRPRKSAYRGDSAAEAELRRL